MLRRETSHKYETKIGTTKFVVESQCPADSKLDMTDSLVSIIKRDLDELIPKASGRKTEVINFEEAVQTVKKDKETR